MTVALDRMMMYLALALRALASATPALGPVRITSDADRPPSIMYRRRPTTWTKALHRGFEARADFQ